MNWTECTPDSATWPPPWLHVAVATFAPETDQRWFLNGGRVSHHRAFAGKHGAVGWRMANRGYTCLPADDALSGVRTWWAEFNEWPTI